MNNPFPTLVTFVSALVAALIFAGALVLSLTCLALGLEVFAWQGAVSAYDLAVQGATTLWPILLIALLYGAIVSLPRAQVIAAFDIAGRWVVGFAVSTAAAAVGLVTLAIGAALYALAGLSLAHAPLAPFLVVCTLASALVALPERPWWSARRVTRPGRATTKATIVLLALVSGAFAVSTDVGSALFVLAPGMLGAVMSSRGAPRWWWDWPSGNEPAPQPVDTDKSHTSSKAARRSILPVLGALGTCLFMPLSQALSVALLVGCLATAASARAQRNFAMYRRSAAGRAALSTGVAAALGVAFLVPAQLTPWRSFPAATTLAGTDLAIRLGPRVGVISKGTSALIVVRCDARAPGRIQPHTFEISGDERGQLRLGGRFTVQRKTEPTLLGTVAGKPNTGVPFAASLQATWAALPHGPNAKMRDHCG